MKRITPLVLLLWLIATLPSPADLIIRGNSKSAKPINPSGGAAFTATPTQTKDQTQVAGAITSATMPGNITAGHLLVVVAKWEGTGSMTSITETTGGGGFTSLTTAATTSNGKTQIWYKLVAAGGGTGLTIVNSGSVTFHHLIIGEWAYTGTCTFIQANQAATDGANNIHTGNVTNSGTSRLNVGGGSEYEGTTFSSFTIGGSGATLVPASWTGNAGIGYSTSNLSAQEAVLTWTTSVACSANLACFAAN